MLVMGDKRKISILHFSQVENLGGIDAYLKLLFSNMNLNIFENSVISSEAVASALKDLEIKKSYILNINQSFSIIKLIFNIIKLRRLIKKENPDILYLHSSFAGVIGRLSAIGLGCKVIYNPHGWATGIRTAGILKNIFYAKIEKMLSFFTDKIVLISKAEFNEAIKIGIAEKKLVTIYNAIQIPISLNKEKRRIKDIMGLDSGKYIIGMVGRVCEQKNIDFFVDFAKAILVIYPDTYFIIVGDGEYQYKKKIQDKIRINGLSDSILITGWVENPQDYIAIFDQAVLFSKWEGFGLAVAEYMAWGKPILISDIDGMSELIEHKVSGLKISNFLDTKEAVEGSVYLRNNTDVAEQMGKNALQTVSRNFNIESRILEIEKLFISLCKEDSVNGSSSSSNSISS